MVQLQMTYSFLIRVYSRDSRADILCFGIVSDFDIRISGFLLLGFVTKDEQLFVEIDRVARGPVEFFESLGKLWLEFAIDGGLNVRCLWFDAHDQKDRSHLPVIGGWPSADLVA